jgi:single-strand DNA-binding protein
LIDQAKRVIYTYAQSVSNNEISTQQKGSFMAGETVITVVGNLTSDPELRYTQNGLAVANFTIASTPRNFDRAANEWKDGDALFLRASVWREFAEHVAGSLTKGSRVIASGRLKQRSYETKEGEKRTTMELEIDEIGPSLRYATAQLTRTQSNGPRAGGQGGGQNGGQGNDEPWAVAPLGTGGAGSPVGVGASGTSGNGGDVWNSPGNFNDETPF